MLVSPSCIRAVAFFHRRLPRPLPFLLQPRPPPRLTPAPPRSTMAFSAESAGEEADEEALPAVTGSGGGGGEVTAEEWRRWGTSSPLPAVVDAVVRELLEMEAESGEKMRFGGVGSKIKGDFKDMEDKKHRAVYETLADSDKKLQYFSARQIACRLLGSRGYLCQKCWLPMEDCMCAKLGSCNLWQGVRFWLYMHPKDFLRQNNTGKLLWQVFGIEAAPLCLFGIQEHEDIMKGKSFVSVSEQEYNPHDMKDGPINFVLLDGTWSNSAALYRRLKERWTAIWGEEDIPCISLSTLSASVMHKLRPQPAWDRTCTAAAAAGLLWELDMRPELSTFEFGKQAEAVECSLDVLLDALTARRIRLGRSITRKQRHNRNCI
uniref:tRNA-uridine aminocarboxypropyltransferase n=1 Tax=Leersia perrieri TaxID=77586 RepID=A0A0D9WQD7_9ORYZ